MSTKKTSTSLAIVPAPGTVMSPSMISEARRLIDPDSYTRLPFWEKLDSDEQKQIIQHTNSVVAGMIAHNIATFAIGYHLIQIQEQLKPIRGAWNQYLTRQFSLETGKHKRMAHRYMEQVRIVAQALPEPLWKAAAARGITFRATVDRPLGDMTEAIELMKSAGEKPPRSEDPAVLNRFWNKAEQYKADLYADPRRKAALRAQTKKQQEQAKAAVEEVRRDPRALQAIVVRTTNKIARLRINQRMTWLEETVGYMMMACGVQGSKSFSALSIPSDIPLAPGRPRRQEAA